MVHAAPGILPAWEWVQSKCACFETNFLDRQEGSIDSVFSSYGATLESMEIWLVQQKATRYSIWCCNHLYAHLRAQRPKKVRWALYYAPVAPLPYHLPSYHEGVSGLSHPVLRPPYHLYNKYVLSTLNRLSKQYKDRSGRIADDLCPTFIVTNLISRTGYTTWSSHSAVRPTPHLGHIIAVYLEYRRKVRTQRMNWTK